jgi:hypothetical protein
MRVNTKKAQAAMEFLMLYGWAVLGVLAAIAVLAYFGLLSPDKLLPEKCTIDSGITCIGAKVQTGQITLVLLNSNQKPLTITGISIEKCNSDFSQEFLPGTQSTFTAENSCDNGNPTEKFKGQVKIKYTDKESGLSKTAYGSLNTRVEE